MVGIINLTQHEATEEQVAVGVIEPKDKTLVKSLLTFDDIPTSEDVKRRALELAEVAVKSCCQQAMIGGAPYLMSSLEAALVDKGVQPLYAFTKRLSVEESMPDGSVRKFNLFKHAGFVKPI